MDFYRKIITKLDFTLLLTIAAILLMGVFVLDSATSHLRSSYVFRQLIWVGIGTVAILVTLRFDYVILKKYYKHLYVLNIILLVAVYLLNDPQKGARSWFPLGPLGNFQPAEVGKIILIITLAQFLLERKGRLNTFKELLPVFVFVGVPTLLSRIWAPHWFM